MKERKLVKLGHSTGVVIPPYILDMVKLSGGDIIDMKVQDEKIIIEKKYEKIQD